ncbi:MAG: carbamoyltransferase HypF [Candidatus Eisenbacteria bacterium]
MDRLAKISSDGEETETTQTVRLKIVIGGVVQGVGFRPFIYRLAHTHGLGGHVLNNPEGVEIEIEGSLESVSAFVLAAVGETPPQARIDTMSVSVVDPVRDERFVIRESSRSAERTVLISPDIATCGDCLAELTDEHDRRYAYPFTNCTNCGPRYTIIGDIPYDRANTTMSEFKMCRECLAEYEDPLDRRFHAEPNACWTCGPRVILRDVSGNPVDCDDPIAEARLALSEGRVVAVKGLGGFHLACDATDEIAVRRLRQRKHREEKPLAVMAPDIETIRTFAEVGDDEEAALLKPSRPIVLLRKRADCGIAQAVAPGNRNIGVMLPYTPVHHLLFEGRSSALVMTSGNISEEPIAIDTVDALKRLDGIGDLFLDHDREILSRCDDSVVRVFEGDTLFLRRSRGWVPLPIETTCPVTGILACGAHLKNTIAVTRNSQVFLSQHIGDLENLAAFEFFKTTVAQIGKIIAVEPDVVAYDLHPDYLSTKFALDLPLKTKIGVQHHHAHIASCLGEAGSDGPVLGMALDGTGYGPDGTVWGCEILLATRKSYSRVGHLEQVGMPGGDRAVKEPWRMALSHLRSALGPNPAGVNLEDLVHKDGKALEVVLAMLEQDVNCPRTSSCGRLFDAVSCLCGIKSEVSYEGQAAIELEMATDETEQGSYSIEIEDAGEKVLIRTRGLMGEIVEDLKRGTHAGAVSARFHTWLAGSLCEAAVRLRERHGIGTVALSGGCFQNAILLRTLRERLLGKEFDVIINHLVPANDGGISFGQAVVAAAMIKDCPER